MREGRARLGTGSCCLAAAALAAVSSWLGRLPALAASRGIAARGLLAAGRAAPGPRARVRRRYEEPDDALDRWEIQDGGREVGFGKHARLTYEEALEQKPGYCNWVLRESQKEDASEMVVDFAQWLQEQGVSPMSSGLVGFGRLADLTYEEALDQDPGFCNWVLRESQKEDPSGMLMDFAQWLQERGVEISSTSARVVGFGKHARLTYEEALEQKPGYCNWVLRESQKEDARERLMDFAQWLQEQGVSPMSSGLVGFGRLADLTYEEALDQDPDFCNWVLRESQKEDPSGMLMDFAQWLQERGVEVEHSER